MALGEKQLERVRARLAKEFPELAGASPQITPQPPAGGDPRYLVVFRGRVALAGGRQLERIVRAVIDEKGRILKWTTSR